MSSIQGLLFVFVVFVNLFLGLLVYFKGHNREAKTNFYHICLSITVWTFTVLLSYLFSSPSLVKIIRNLTYIGPAFIPPLFLQFSFIFPQKKAIPKYVNFLIFIPAVYFSVSAFFSQIAAEVKLTASGVFVGVTRYHANFYLFIFYFIAFSLFAFYKIFQNYQKARGLEKMQLRYVFSGILLATACATVTNLILPACGEHGGLKFGPLFSVIMVVAFTYAIVKHRLMDIKIIFRRGLVYSLATITVMVFYVTLLLIFEKLFHQLLRYASWPVILLAVFVITLSFNFILDNIKKLIDYLFFPERISYRKTLQESSHKLTSLINLREILNLFITVIPQQLEISSVRIFLWDENKKIFYLKSAAGDLRGKLERTNIKNDEALVHRLRSYEEPLDIEILRRRPAQPQLKETVETMELMAANLIIPFFTKNKLIAFLILGPKNSGEMYTKEDITLLMALADEGAVAIENAQLYQEVLDMKNYQEDILKALAIGIISTNLEGKIVTINPKTEEMLGFSTKEIWEKRWYEIIKNPGLKNMIPEILTTGRQYVNLEIELEQKNGQKISVAINTSFLKNSEKKITGILITLMDLTKIKNLEAQIRQAEKLSTMGELVAGVAHEINNPLTTIACYKDILESYFKEKGTEVEARTLEGLTTAVEHLRKVVENFLRFARKTQEVWINTDINKVITDALAITRPNLNVSKVEVEEIYEPELPEIFADHAQLVQVFTNLIVNACHAMPQGGKLIISAEYDIGKKQLEIMIKDTGAGIAPENLPKIFDSFFTTKELTQGTGLGLSVSLGIIQKHKGSIEVKSQLGAGTTFIIRLPEAKKS